MAEILIAALSPIGHITPLLAIAQDLVARGDHVTVMTGAAHTDAVHATGAQSHPLPALADFDEKRSGHGGDHHHEEIDDDRAQQQASVSARHKSQHDPRAGGQN